MTIKGMPKGAPKGIIANQDYDLTHMDTPPDQIQIWFQEEDTFLPTIMDDSGNILREEKWEKYVYFCFSYDLGHCEGRKRVNDKIKRNPETGKWEILSFEKTGQSHILNHQAQWDAFYDGLDYNEIGTPLEILFPQNPGMCKHLKRIGVSTVERLARLTDTETQLGGMGVSDASKKAKAYLERMAEGAKGREVDAYITALESAKKADEARIQALEATVARLAALAEANQESTPKAKKKQTKEIQAEA